MKKKENVQVMYYYSPDTSLGEDGKRNPIPFHLRQRRQVVAGVVKGNQLLFGRSECSMKHFIKSEGRDKARGRALSSKPLMRMEVSPTTEIAKVFLLAAKELILPGPKLVITTKTVLVIKKAKKP